MKINWKQVAQSPGYKSLKAAYIKDVKESASRKNPMRGKAEYLELFNWVINRAKYYAHHTGMSIEDVLLGWESKRNYWWLNYYQEGNQPKLRSDAIKPKGIRGLRKSYKEMAGWYNPGRLRKVLQELSIKKSKKEKPRWSMARKKRSL